MSKIELEFKKIAVRVMDEETRLPQSNGHCGRPPASFPRSNDTTSDFWHSTPVKKKTGGAFLDESQPHVLTRVKMDSASKQWDRGTPPIQTDILNHHRLQDREFPVRDLSGSTVQRQRRELQLLMAELKDRDRELNTMAASHREQLHTWEQDRQKVLALEQRCARLGDELQKRNEVIKVLTQRVWVVETREEEVQKELRSARNQLCELGKKQEHISQKCEDYEEKTQSLNSTVMALSTQVGSLQVREEELSSMLKLKDKDVNDASGQIVKLKQHLRDVEASLMENRSRESKLQRELEENKRRYKEARHENTHLKEELQQQVTQSSTQREEMIRLKQELQLLRTDLALSGEGDSWKDELLELARSKQERTMSELRCLRQVCENQRSDLQLLQLNLESARENLRERSSQGLPPSQEELRCACAENRSPSSVRGKNFKLADDGETSPAAIQQRAASSDRGVCAAHLMDADVFLSSRSLQQLLDESRQVIQASSERGTTESLYHNKYQTSPLHHPSPQTYKQVSELHPKPAISTVQAKMCGRPDMD